MSVVKTDHVTEHTAAAGVTADVLVHAPLGINFGNDTLNHFQTGTWVPSVGGTATYNSQFGSFVKIGKMVWVSFDLTISAIGTGSSNAIVNLPFPSGVSGQPQPGTVGYFNALAVAVVFIGAYIADSSTNVTIVSTTASATGVAGNAVLTSGSRLVFSGWYLAVS